MIPRPNGRVPRDRPIDKIVRFGGEKHPTSRPLQYSCNCNLLQKAGIIPRLVDDAANDYLAICHLV